MPIISPEEFVRRQQQIIEESKDDTGVDHGPYNSSITTNQSRVLNWLNSPEVNCCYEN